VSPRVLLVDYGEVVSQSQPPEAISSMAELAGLERELFLERYWEHRPAHDQGGSAREFWSAVLGIELSDEPLLDELVRQDVAGWSHLNPDTLTVLSDAHRRGVRLALLSNAPHEVAAAVRADPALAIFDHLSFSAELGVVKPDPAAFRAVLEMLDLAPGEVLFIDDRPENVAAAIETGMRAVRFSSAERLADTLRAP
jgi:putative hydrolase of the HAD superfamily